MRQFILSLLLMIGMSFADNTENKNISLASGFGGYSFGSGMGTAGFDVGGWLYDSYIKSDTFLFFLRGKTYFTKKSFSVYANPSFVDCIDKAPISKVSPNTGDFSMSSMACLW